MAKLNLKDALNTSLSRTKLYIDTELAKKADSSHGTHLTLGTGSGNAFRGDYGNTAYQHSQAAHAPSNAQKNSDITKAEIEAKLTGAITSHTHSYLPLSGGTISGNIYFADVTSTTYPAKSTTLTWNGSTDGADIYYQVDASDKGRLVLNTRDDADCIIAFANKGTIISTIDNSGNFSGNASTATKATQDSAGQQINTTYIKGLSVSGKTITYTKGDGTTGTITTQDNNTTYTAGTGMALSGTTFNHKNSVTAGTAQGDSSKTLSWSGTFTIPTVTYDAQGHITGKGTTTMTMPSNPNSDTKVTNTLNTTTKAYVTGTTSSSTNTGTQVFDTGVYLDTTAGMLTATTFKGALSGNAGTATKLATARTINGTSFDGSANITTANWGTARTLTIGNKGQSVNGSGNVSWALSDIMGRATTTSSTDTNKNKYTKFARVDISGGAYRSCTGTFDFVSVESGHVFGILTYYLRTSSAITSTSISLAWKTLTNVAYASSVVAVKVSDGIFDLYYKPVNDWDTMSITNINSNGIGYITLYSNQSFTSSVTATATSSLVNHSTTAAKLTTARTLTIGNTGKSFDGSGNVSWSLSEIGAAPASHGTHLTIGTGASNAAAGNHTHNYAGSSSAGGTANSVNGLTFWTGTQSAYNALSSKSNTTVYLITG